MDIVVLITGATPESPAEFRFLNGPTTYWTVTKNVTNFAKPIATSTPTPAPTPEATPIPVESPPPTVEQNSRKHKRGAPLDDDNGRRIWHQVDGKWKWYPVGKHHLPVKKASPSDQAPVVNP